MFERSGIKEYALKAHRFCDASLDSHRDDRISSKRIQRQGSIPFAMDRCGHPMAWQITKCHSCGRQTCLKYVCRRTARARVGREVNCRDWLKVCKVYEGASKTVFSSQRQRFFAVVRPDTGPSEESRHGIKAIFALNRRTGADFQFESKPLRCRR